MICGWFRSRENAGRTHYVRCAVQVPEQRAALHVPEPDVPVRVPEPTARFIPLASVTLMAPAAATRPDAVTAALFEAT